MTGRAQPRNIEIKARVPVEELESLRRRIRDVAGGPPRVLVQRDTFFPVERGRLKLREHEGGPSELIFYDRPDIPGPKPSSYSRESCPAELRQLFSRALGVRGVVEKRRELSLVGPTRIHLDEVRGLGTWLELEVVLQEGQADEDGEAIADDLLEKLGVPAGRLVSGSYIDHVPEGVR